MAVFLASHNLRHRIWWTVCDSFATCWRYAIRFDWLILISWCPVTVMCSDVLSTEKEWSYCTLTTKLWHPRYSALYSACLAILYYHPSSVITVRYWIYCPMAYIADKFMSASCWSIFIHLHPNLFA